jgi:hypothetical protein
MDVSSRIVSLDDKVALFRAFIKPHERMSDAPFEYGLELGLVLSFIDA